MDVMPQFVFNPRLYSGGQSFLFGRRGLLQKRPQFLFKLPLLPHTETAPNDNYQSDYLRRNRQ
jgi:hypothetical protein